MAIRSCWARRSARVCRSRSTRPWTGHPATEWVWRSRVPAGVLPRHRRRRPQHVHGAQCRQVPTADTQPDHPARPRRAQPAHVLCNRAGNNGNIVLIGNSIGPVSRASDSDGSRETVRGPTRFSPAKSSGQRLSRSPREPPRDSSCGTQRRARPDTTTERPHTSLRPRRFATNNQNYVGQLSARSQRITRVPADKRYHCTNVPTSVQPLCTTPDPISGLQSLSSIRARRHRAASPRTRVSATRPPAHNAPERERMGQLSDVHSAGQRAVDTRRRHGDLQRNIERRRQGARCCRTRPGPPT